jgi:hypothetical protein
LCFFFLWWIGLNLLSEEKAAKGDCKLIEINHELQDNHESQSLVASDPSPPKLKVCDEEVMLKKQSMLKLC